MVVRAPQARQMVARGEREARSPWNVREKKYRPGRPTETGQRGCRPAGGASGPGSGAPPPRLMVARGTCERSDHAAPGSQIKSARAPEGRQSRWPVSVGLPGLYFFSRTFQGLRASRSPLATFCRACGALTTMSPTRTSCSRPGLMFPTRTLFPTGTHVPDQD
jgi:hypothetical protein